MDVSHLLIGMAVLLSPFNAGICLIFAGPNGEKPGDFVGTRFASQSTVNRLASENKKALILIVEDDPNARRLLCYMLSNVGHEIVETDDGDDAISLLDKYRFDLVVTDLALPRTTGFGIISHAHAKWPRLPVILVTGYLGKRTAEQLDQYVEYIPKPIDRDRFIATVDRLV